MGYHNVTRPVMSCAVREVEGIDSASTGPLFCKDVYVKTEQMPFGHKFRFVMFSHYNHHFKQCEEICKYIEENNLGTCMRSDKAINPNTDNEVQIYIWNITNWDLYDLWYKTEVLGKQRIRLWSRIST